LDKKIRIKFNRRVGKFTIDYSKVHSTNTVRFDLLKQINDSHDVFIMVNTAIDMCQTIKKTDRHLNLATDQGYQMAEAFLQGSGYDYRLKKAKKDFSKSIMGFSTGKTESRTVALMAVAVGKGQLSQDFFDTLGCSHDLMIGIDPKKPAGSLLDDFERGLFDSIEQEGNFAFTMIDSQWLGYFYTDFDPAGLE